MNYNIMHNYVKNLLSVPPKKQAEFGDNATCHTMFGSSFLGFLVSKTLGSHRYREK